MSEPSQAKEQRLLNELPETFFLLRKSSSSSPITIEVDFSPLPAQAEATCSPLRTLPIFHNDRNYFTPSFILEVDQERYEENQEIYRNVHYRKLAQISEQKSEISVPKPSPNNSFCCICKTAFPDYLEHLNQPKHRYLLRKSDYYSKINEICSQMDGKAGKGGLQCLMRKKRGRPAKAKLIKKEIYLGKSLSGKETDESVENGQKINQVMG